MLRWTIAQNAPAVLDTPTENQSAQRLRLMSYNTGYAKQMKRALKKEKRIVVVSAPYAIEGTADGSIRVKRHCARRDSPYEWPALEVTQNREAPNISAMEEFELINEKIEQERIAQEEKLIQAEGVYPYGVLPPRVPFGYPPAEYYWGNLQLRYRLNRAERVKLLKMKVTDFASPTELQSRLENANIKRLELVREKCKAHAVYGEDPSFVFDEAAVIDPLADEDDGNATPVWISNAREHYMDLQNRLGLLNFERSALTRLDMSDLGQAGLNSLSVLNRRHRQLLGEMKDGVPQYGEPPEDFDEELIAIQVAGIPSFAEIPFEVRLEGMNQAHQREQLNTA
jgi:hypothetical protein